MPSLCQDCNQIQRSEREKILFSFYLLNCFPFNCAALRFNKGTSMGSLHAETFHQCCNQFLRSRKPVCHLCSEQAYKKASGAAKKSPSKIMHFSNKIWWILCCNLLTLEKLAMFYAEKSRTVFQFPAIFAIFNFASCTQINLNRKYLPQPNSCEITLTVFSPGDSWISILTNPALKLPPSAEAVPSQLPGYLDPSHPNHPSPGATAEHS